MSALGLLSSSEINAATELRDRLIEMTKSDPKRRQAVLALLAKIESWRLEYGRPIGETRNPVLGTETAWPPTSKSVDVDERVAQRNTPYAEPKKGYTS
jgi:hypothetical protein